MLMDAFHCNNRDTLVLWQPPYNRTTLEVHSKPQFIKYTLVIGNFLERLELTLTLS